jgi:hypothetical protein
MTEPDPDSQAQEVGDKLVDAGAVLVPDRLVDTKTAAELLGLKPNTVRKQRIYGGGCSFHKIGAAVRYSLREIERFKAARLHANTSEYWGVGGAGGVA